MKIGKRIENRPLHLWGVIALFFFVLFAEMTFGSLFYSQGIKTVAENLSYTSWVIHIGLLITKAIILFCLLRLVMVRYPATEIEEKTLSSFSLIKTLKWLGILILLVICYRLAFDSYIAVILFRIFGTSSDLGWSMYLLMGVPALGYSYIFLTAPIFEEVVYRGLFYNGLRKNKYSPMVAGCVSAFLFAVMHMNIIQGINAFALGLLTAYLYEKTGKLKMPIVFHILNNLYVTLFSDKLMYLQQYLLPYRLIGTALAMVALYGILKYIGKLCLSYDSKKQPD